MLQMEHSAILSTFIKLPIVIKIFILSIFEWPFYTGFSVCLSICRDSGEKRRLQTTKSDTAIAQNKLSNAEREQNSCKQPLSKANSEAGAQSLKVKSSSW